jgi:uncharacterized membrane protein (UPF0136 family)
MMNLAIVAAIAYGILTLVGGIVGYLKSQSQVSLISGIVTGLLLLLSAFLQLQGNPGGLLLARIVTLILIAVFAVRFAKTRKVMPAGIMIIAGAIVLILLR